MSISWRDEPGDNRTVAEVSAVWKSHMTEDVAHNALYSIRQGLKATGDHGYYLEYVDLLVRYCDEHGIEVEDIKLHHIKAKLGFL